MMKEILELMEEKKQDHLDTLQWLQKQPRTTLQELARGNAAWDEENNDDDNVDGNVDDNNDGVLAQQRASARLATKQRIDYKKMNAQGKDDWMIGEY